MDESKSQQLENMLQLQLVVHGWLAGDGVVSGNSVGWG